jgi:hypothetical protein
LKIKRYGDFTNIAIGLANIDKTQEFYIAGAVIVGSIMLVDAAIHIRMKVKDEDRATWGGGRKRLRTREHGDHGNGP